jgi:hypothetical protein
VSWGIWGSRFVECDGVLMDCADCIDVRVFWHCGANFSFVSRYLLAISDFGFLM